jgi:NOL1/NOP2/fmu family ribosome biogenesis protein
MIILTSKEKKKLIEQLNNQFGIEKIEYPIIKFGNDRFRIFTGELSKDILDALQKELRIETAGLYFAKQEKDGLRLTIDGILLLKNQIAKNIIELDQKQTLEWLKGQELYIKYSNCFVILKHDNDFLGCGKSTGKKITNFVPKERRLK